MFKADLGSCEKVRRTQCETQEKEFPHAEAHICKQD